MPAGRPTDYDPVYCDSVIGWGKDGKSLAWMAAEIGVSKQTVNRWMLAHPEFCAAMEKARTLAQRWWEDKGQSNLESQHFQAALWSRSMAARFGDDWREVRRQENTGPDGGPQQVVTETHDEFSRRIASLAARADEERGDGTSQSE